MTQYSKHNLFKSDKDILSNHAHDMVFNGSPDFFYEARDNKETQEIITFCHHKKVPITFCGSQTSMTGSSVAESGLALSLVKKNKILDFHNDPKTNEAFVITEPGVILEDLKNFVIEQGYYYPPDPTSYKEVQIGSTVSTNATGEDTFKYGPTRRYVQEIEIITATGKTRTLTRKHEIPHSIFKNNAGYYLHGDEIDEVIGSEGTLALITKIKLKLLPHYGKNQFLIILPFSDFKKTIQAVTEILNLNLQPRALELIGHGAGNYFRSCPSCPKELQSEENFLYIKEEYHDQNDLNQKIDNWYKHLKNIYNTVSDSNCLNRVFFAQTDQQLNDIHDCRHYIPLKVNEEYFNYIPQGGGKIGTDWWVPKHHILNMMLETYENSLKKNYPFLVFAHIGNGHPHWNYLTKNPTDKIDAIEFIKEQCQKAVKYGGGVAGEHGIGKIKRYLLGIQHDNKTIKKMLNVKEKWDPSWIFGRNNLFEYPLTKDTH